MFECAKCGKRSESSYGMECILNPLTWFCYECGEEFSKMSQHQFEHCLKEFIQPERSKREDSHGK